MGWDSSPRAHPDDEYANVGYPFMNTIRDNTPEHFRTALELARQRLLAETNGLRILNLNCWNEWRSTKDRLSNPRDQSMLKPRKEHCELRLPNTASRHYAAIKRTCGECSSANRRISIKSWRS